MTCRRLLEDGSYRLLEDGDFRLLEQCDDDGEVADGNIYASLHNDERVFPLMVSSKLGGKEMVCARAEGTQRNPGKVFPLRVNCCDRKKP